LLLQNPYIVGIRAALQESPQSFADLGAIFARLGASRDIDKLLNAYLEAIVFMNQQAGQRGKPLLDYRIHVFVQNLNGNLKQCPQCLQYFGGNVQHCPSDGYTLFAVYCHDIRLLIGKFNGQDLSPNLEPESTDFDKVHYVLIGTRVDTSEQDFPISGNLGKNGDFEPNPQGAYALRPLVAENYEQLENVLIYIGDEKRDYLYLYHLAKTILQLYRKSLAFIDNREQASRYSAIIRDELTSEFFFQFLVMSYPRERELNLSKTLENLVKKSQQAAISDLEKAIFKELPLWFYRMTAIPERLGGTPALIRRRKASYDWENLSALQLALLDIFIKEKAIQSSFSDTMPDSHFIRFQKFWASHHYGIFVEDTLSQDPAYRGISLGESASIYRSFVEKWSFNSIQAAIDELLGLSILIRESTPDGKKIYYINSDYLSFDLPDSEFGDDYDKLKKKHIFVAEVHSSDLKNNERERIETAFKRDEVNFVVATPTLEMGIDIGDLETVLMIGAAPNGASYAQRAGRAGRGKRHEALILSFCAADSPHDSYAFHNPKKFINGIVSPPSFNPRNGEILKKHINAFVLQKYIKHRDALKRFLLEAEQNYRNEIPQLNRIFGDWFPYADYFTEFKDTVQRVLQATDAKNVSPMQYCYSQGIFPDYSFRREQVIAIDLENKDEIEADDPFAWNDFALTKRDIEQAIRFFVPEQSIYVAGEIYKTLDDGIYEILADGARQYRCFYVEKEILFAHRSKEIKRLDMRQYFSAADGNLLDMRGVLAMGYTNTAILSFRNYGIRGQLKEKKPNPIGYDLEREAVVLRFDSMISSDVLRTSLVAVLVRVINKRYGLADSEVSLLMNAKLANESDSNWVYTLLYDKDGNNNLPFAKIINEFDEILRAASALLQCDCDSDGCYNCIRSYEMQYYNANISKERARMFVHYLLGAGRYEPSVLPYKPTQVQFDLVLSVRQQKNEIIVQSSQNREYRHPLDMGLSDVLFQTLGHAVKAEYQTGMKNLKIETRFEWLANSINQRSVKKAKDAFDIFQFELLPFKHVQAEYLKG
jgi:hypothetical protein